MTPESAPAYTEQHPNLADASLGAAVLAVSDEFFAACERMLDPAPPRFEPGLYDDHGKWMDGWETRRRRDGGHDWCVLRLALPGDIVGLEIDTRFFTGNAPTGAMLECALLSPGAEPDDNTEWRPLLGLTAIQGDDRRFITLDASQPCSHVRLHIYPDGGVARLRLYGTVRPPEGLVPDAERDLIALTNGGRALACSDAHYGHPQNLLRPGRGVNMGDGWETRRRREPGHDWCILALGEAGIIERIEVDTAHFKGNFPAACSIQAALIEGSPEAGIVTPQSMFWKTLLPEQPLQANAVHAFAAEVVEFGPVTHLRFNILPDGGVSRLRAYGHPA
ncbi:MAG: allantoicase [Acidihalobacter sp.]|uniref:allantoicase n=1 Tax=Acidihalobacter sp. TaxID=1872108 RepID=UPI00307E1C91